MGKHYSIDELNDEIQNLMTADFHSLEITGGEPLLHAEYIKEFLTRYSYKAMLETNATIPENINILKDVIDLVSMDIKLPEHFNDLDEWNDIYSKELESVKLMHEENIKYYLKIVVTDKTPLDVIKQILDDLTKIQSDSVEIFIQPVSPMSKWDDKSHLFEISELVGKYYPVSIIPQIHKYMQIE